jgi:hypothetical protein
MSAPPPPKRPRTDGGVPCIDALTAIATGTSAGVENEPAMTLPRFAVCDIEARLAEHSAVARSLITTDEGAVEAALTCCTTLVREHGVGLGAAVEAILADHADCGETSWQDLPQLREQPLAAALVGCDEYATQRLHTFSEMLQFPKRISLLLLRQLAVFRVRVAAAAGDSDTAALVRAEPVLAPLLEQAEAFVKAHFTRSVGPCSLLPLYRASAFWLGFFADPEDVVSFEFDRRELDHVVYAAGHLLAGRGLLPDLLATPLAGCARELTVLAEIAAVSGDAATILSLHQTGYVIEPHDCTIAAASAGHVLVLQLAISIGWEFSTGACVTAAAQAHLDIGSRRQVLAFLRQKDPSCADWALRSLADAGHLECVRWLLEVDDFSAESKAHAVEAAALEGHIPVMHLLLERGASVTQVALQDSKNVATLQWCAEHGCTVDSAFLRSAVAHGSVFQLEWAASVTDITEFLTANMFAVAARSGEMASVEWLRVRWYLLGCHCYVPGSTGQRPFVLPIRIAIRLPPGWLRFGRALRWFAAAHVEAGCASAA